MCEAKAIMSEYNTHQTIHRCETSEADVIYMIVPTDKRESKKHEKGNTSLHKKEKQITRASVL